MDRHREGSRARQADASKAAAFESRPAPVFAPLVRDNQAGHRIYPPLPGFLCGDAR
jgi:hypothetical protein